MTSPSRPEQPQQPRTAAGRATMADPYFASLPGVPFYDRLLDRILRIEEEAEATAPEQDEAVRQAIGIVESSRLTHVHWAEWRRGGGTGDDMAGDLAHHEEAIKGYDFVLSVLRDLLASPPPVPAAHPGKHVDAAHNWFYDGCLIEDGPTEQDHGGGLHLCDVKPVSPPPVPAKEDEDTWAITESVSTPMSESATSERGTTPSGESGTDSPRSVEDALVAAQEAIWPPILLNAPANHLDTARAALRRDAPRLIEALEERGLVLASPPPVPAAPHRPRKTYREDNDLVLDEEPELLAVPAAPPLDVRRRTDDDR